MVEDCGVEHRRLRVDGSAVENDLLCRLQADVLGCEIDRPVVAETTAFGDAYAVDMAMCYWETAGAFASVYKSSRPNVQIVDMALYPSEQWLAEYARLLDANAAFGDLSLGWGDGFDGDVVFVIEDLPLAETTIADLPEEALTGLPEGVVDSFGDVSLADAPATFDESVRSSLPDRARDLVRQIEENVVDGAIHAHVGLEEGGCTGTEVLEDPAAHDAGFQISAKYPVWRDLVEGRPPTSAMLTGDLDVSGNQLRQVQYAPLFQVLGKVAADVETEHLFDGAGRRPGDVILDEAVRQPAFLHRTAQRQVLRTFDMF